MLPKGLRIEPRRGTLLRPRPTVLPSVEFGVPLREQTRQTRLLPRAARTSSDSGGGRARERLAAAVAAAAAVAPPAAAALAPALAARRRVAPAAAAASAVAAAAVAALRGLVLLDERLVVGRLEAVVVVRRAAVGLLEGALPSGEFRLRSAALSGAALARRAAAAAAAVLGTPRRLACGDDGGAAAAGAALDRRARWATGPSVAVARRGDAEQASWPAERAAERLAFCSCSSCPRAGCGICRRPPARRPSPAPVGG